jgi:hypothetical protein
MRLGVHLILLANKTELYLTGRNKHLNVTNSSQSVGLGRRSIQIGHSHEIPDLVAFSSTCRSSIRFRERLYQFFLLAHRCVLINPTYPPFSESSFLFHGPQSPMLRSPLLRASRRTLRAFSVRTRNGREDGRWGDVDALLVLDVSKEAFSVLKAA